MQSNIHKKNKILGIILLASLVINCKGKNYLENQITIKINLIDSKTKQFRVNKFDTIEVRKESEGYLMKTYNIVGEYVTDSKGSVTIKIDRDAEYRIMLNRRGLFGSESFAKSFNREKLKDGQEVDIEVFSIENW